MDIKTKRKNQILRAARSVFNEKGFHDAKMNDIAVAASVGKGTVYEYFSSKQEVFDESCIMSLVEIHEKLNELIGCELSFLEKTKIIINYILTESIQMTGRIDAVCSNENVISEKLHEAFKKHMEFIYEILNKLTQQGKLEGIINPDVDNEVIGTIMIGSINQFFIKNYLKRKEPVEASEIEKYFDLFLNGFGVR